MSFKSPKPRARRPLLAAVCLTMLLGGLALGRHALASDTDAQHYPQASLSAPSDQAALIARGKYLTVAADCMPCHTGPGHAPFSGGLVLNTPFGPLTSPNITPDQKTGIGSWSDQQFYEAVHDGISPGRSYLVFPKYLYPAMPFTSYTKLSRADVMAIKAYLFSLKPVQAPRAPNGLNFPFNQRPVLLGWRILFFSSGPMRMDPHWDEAMKKGAYLTEALGHCGECHTPRNVMGAMMLGQAYAGSPIDAFYAPNISSDHTYGVGGWPQSDLVAYLYNDGNMTKGSAFGPMGEVVENSTSQIPQSDVVDIANYLQHETKPQRVPAAPARGTPASVTDGSEIYAANCAGCHGQDGAGRPTIIPNLAHNDSVTAAQPYNVIGAVLSGLPGWKGGPPMPAFATSLSDRQIAAVANYVRNAWGNGMQADATPRDVMRLRAVADVPAMANMAADKFGCPHVSAAGGNDTLADPGNGLLDIYDGATPQTLPNRTRALIAALRAGNGDISDTDLTNTLIAAYCPVVANTPGLSEGAKKAALANFVTGATLLVNEPVAAAH